MTIEELAVRVANLESVLRDVQNWRDPKNTIAKINLAYERIAELHGMIANATAEMKNMKSGESLPSTFGTLNVSTEIPEGPEVAESPKSKRRYKKRK